MPAPHYWRESGRRQHLVGEPRWESMAPSDLSRSERIRSLMASSTAVMLAVAGSWCPLPKMTTSDLSAFSCKPLCKNHSRTADEQTARRSRPASYCLCSSRWTAACRRRTGSRTYCVTGWARRLAMKSSGPSTEPYSTPHWHSIVADECWPSFTCCCSSARYECSQAMAASRKPKSVSNRCSSTS